MKFRSQRVASALSSRAVIEPMEQRLLMSVTAVPAKHDAVVRDGSYGSVNHGKDATLRVKNDVTSYTRRSYLMFDTSAVSGTATKAVLRLYGRAEVTSATATVPLIVSGVSNTTWTETGITYANKPATDGVTRASASVGQAAKWIELDVSGYVAAQRAAGKKVISLALIATKFGGAQMVFNSEEASANDPVLVITTGTTTTPPPSPPPSPPPTPLPPPPTSNLLAPGFAGVVPFNDRILVSWPAVTGAASYNIYRSVDSTATPTLYKSGIKGTSYNDYGTVIGKAYRYQIAAVASNGGVGARSVKVYTKGGAEASDVGVMKGDPNDASNWYLARHQSYLNELAAMQGKVDMLLVGDSITDFWRYSGREALKRWTNKFPVMNLGVGGDSTQNVIWRLEHGEVAGINPKVAMVLIGGNNLPTHTNAQVVAGITKTVRVLQQRLPNTKVLLLGLFPNSTANSPNRTRIKAINATLASLDAADPRMTFMDIGNLFVDSAGNLRPDRMLDGSHPNAAGYHAWVDAVQPTLDQMMK